MLTKLLKKFYPDAKITKFWENPRKRALVLLPLWILFIVIIYAIYIMPYQGKSHSQNNSYNNETENSNVSSEDRELLESSFMNLFNMDYKFSIIIYQNGDVISYEGEKTSLEIKGIKKINDETLEYYIKDNMIYRVNNGNYTEVDLLSNKNYDMYTDPEAIYNDLRNLSFQKLKSGYLYEKGEDYVIITLSDYISSIEVNLKDTKYILNFVKID